MSNFKTTRIGRFFYAHRQLLSFVLLTIAFLYVVYLGDKVNNNQAQAIARQDRAQRAASLEALRNCIRHNTNSAIIQISASRKVPGRTQKQRAQGFKFSRNLYPLVLCQASQQTGKLVVMSAKEREKYVKIIAGGRAPDIRGEKVLPPDEAFPTLVDSLKSLE